MNIIAYAFIAAGYALFYWGANNIKHWNRTVQTSEAATMGMLLGTKQVTDAHDWIHPIPFPYTAPTAADAPSSGTGTGSANAPQSSGRANLNPRYPGGNTAIPTPPVGGIPA